VRAQVDLEAPDVESFDSARGIHQRVGVVHRAPPAHDRLAQHPQVLALESLLSRCFDPLARRVGALWWTIAPDPRVDGHAAPRGGLERLVQHVQGFVQLPGHSGHHVGDPQVLAELHLQPAKRRLGRP
jgi:hypothetical protein